MADEKFIQNLEKFPELKDIAIWLGTNHHEFLSSIYQNAYRWLLSDKQIEAAKKSWDKINLVGRTDVILFDERRKKLWIRIIRLYLPQPNYYNPSEFNSDMLRVILNTGKLTKPQFAALTKKLTKYKKSILKKIFK